MTDTLDPAADAVEPPLVIACIQTRPVFGDRDANLARILALVAEAADRGAGLIVLPELCTTGYVFRSRAEAFALAESVPDGPASSALTAAAARHGAVIVAGIAERAGDRLYNSAVLVGPAGPIGVFRKNHLWGEETLWFERGDLGMPVFHTPIGRLACAICYDGWFPETYRLAALQGAEILCVPTNWVPMPGQPADVPAMANVLAMAGAHSNGLFVACADRVGVERGQPFLGRSVIVSHTGFPVAGPASADGEEILLAAVRLSDARRRRAFNPFNQPLRDRRTDVYAEMLGSAAAPAWY